MNESEAIEFRLRPGPRGLVRHAMIEDAPASFCGMDRSILSDAQVKTPVQNCPVCMHGVQRQVGLNVYLRSSAA